MRIFKWTADFDYSNESPLTPVWVHFPGLPVFLYEAESLLSVANSIGKPLRIHALNTNRVKLGVASVCVELDVSKPLVDKVWVSFEDDDYPDNNEGFWQQVQDDEIPQYCSKYFHMGHSVGNCKRDFEKERMQAEKGKMEMGPNKPAYVKHRNYRRVYNPKATQPSKIPKPADTITTRKMSKCDIIINRHRNVAACVTLLRRVHARKIKTRKNVRVKKYWQYSDIYAT
ncbi:hypothetical protein LIER_35177 [Lithospermum erythrorhizon]|uniref:DUF4283 domain-containing protein n=1 Tax=Lithospermum erythrorhizon TaxID=34254 RepID=A0AAV3NPJ2_LITER